MLAPASCRWPNSTRLNIHRGSGSLSRSASSPRTRRCGTPHTWRLRSATRDRSTAPRQPWPREGIRRRDPVRRGCGAPNAKMAPEIRIGDGLQNECDDDGGRKATAVGDDFADRVGLLSHVRLVGSTATAPVWFGAAKRVNGRSRHTRPMRVSHSGWLSPFGTRLAGFSHRISQKLSRT